MTAIEIQFLLGLYFFITAIPVTMASPLKVTAAVQFIFGVLLLVAVYFNFSILGM